MALSLPYTLSAGSPENINQVQANFDAISTAFPISYNSSNFSAVPQVRVTASSVTSIPSGGVYTSVAWNTETYDTGTPSNNMHDTVTNNSRITCKVAGLYDISACTGPATNTGGIGIRIYLNGTTTIAEYLWGGVAAVNSLTVPITTKYRLAVNDYIEVQCSQNSGGAVNTSNANGQHFQATMVSV